MDLRTLLTAFNIALRSAFLTLAMVINGESW